MKYGDLGGRFSGKSFILLNLRDVFAVFWWSVFIIADAIITKLVGDPSSHFTHITFPPPTFEAIFFTETLTMKTFPQM